MRQIAQFFLEGESPTLKLCYYTNQVKQLKNISWFLLDSFQTNNVSKITCSISLEDFWLNFKFLFLLHITQSFVLKIRYLQLRRKKFVLRGAIGSNLPCYALSFLVHFILVTIFKAFLLLKILLSTVLKLANSIL